MREHLFDECAGCRQHGACPHTVKAAHVTFRCSCDCHRYPPSRKTLADLDRHNRGLVRDLYRWYAANPAMLWHHPGNGHLVTPRDAVNWWLARWHGFTLDTGWQ